MSAKSREITPKLHELCDAVAFLHARGFCPGTGGNFSVVHSNEPLSLWITKSGIDKGTVAESDLLHVDERGDCLSGSVKPSAETLLHCVIARERQAESILHTHSVWNTFASLSELSREGILSISGFEMLKGLSGVTTHEHTEEIPILDNSQDMQALSSELQAVFERFPACHAVLLKGHGLYTWGSSVSEARRHVEILEFLFEVVGRLHSGEIYGFSKNT